MSKLETNDLARYAAAFRALGNPHRLRLFLRLTACCPPGTACDAERDAGLCVGDLGEDLEVAPSTLSHHLKELNRAGLVHMERRGQRVQCRVDPDGLEDLAAFFRPTPSGDPS